MKKHRLNQEQILMDAFRFNLRDLQSNREGRITKSHSSKIFQRDARYSQQVIAGLVVVAFISILAMLIEWVSNNRGSGLMGMLGFMGLAFSGILLLPSISRLWQMTVQVHSSHQIAAIQGIIVLDTSPQRPMVKIGRVKLRAHRDALLTLKHMSPYVIHYLPKSKIIVSVEAMES